MMRFLCLLVLLPTVVVALPRVGPLDGTLGPTLPAVALPMLGGEEELPNTALPKALEAKGLLAPATLEWARIELDARGAERTQALEALTRLSLLQDAPLAAENYLQVLQAQNPTYDVPENILLAQLVAEVSTTQALTDLQTRFPTTKGSVTARWADVWRQAHTGQIRQAWGLPEATQLQQRLDEQAAVATTQYNLAVGLSMVPGLGQASLGKYGAAALELLGWLVFGWAFYSACRYRHYAYAFVFVFPWVGLWLHAPVNAAIAAEAAARLARAEAMQTWQDLRPTYIPAT